MTTPYIAKYFAYDLTRQGGDGKRDLCERTFEFALRNVKLCQTLDVKPGVGRTIARQLIRSGTSVGANVEEGQAQISLLTLHNSIFPILPSLFPIAFPPFTLLPNPILRRKL